MYDFPATREANDAFWTLIRRNLGFGPDRLCRDGEVWRHWCAPDLILSQTCGLPFRARLSDRVALVGTPDYGLPGCAPGHYFSVILVRGDLGGVDPADFPGMRLACNDALSQSGWAAAHAHAADHGVAFETVLSTGSHHASATAVAEDRADIAFVDAVTWRHIGADPFVSGPCGHWPDRADTGTATDHRAVGRRWSGGGCGRGGTGGGWARAARADRNSGSDPDSSRVLSVAARSATAAPGIGAHIHSVA